MRAARTGVLMMALAIAVHSASAAATSQAPGPARAEVPEVQRVDINHATLEELLKVPGMTKSWAGRIVRFRPYRTKQDLVEKGVVNGEVYNRIKDYIIAHREKQ